MEFEWDDVKRQEVMAKRGVDILYAAQIFDDIVFTKADERADYGEPRRISLGHVEGEIFIVVHTERNGVTRLITAWKGGRRDQEQYQAGISRRDQENG